MFTDWCKREGIQPRRIQFGKPDQTAYIGRFKRTYCEEVVSAYPFESLTQGWGLTEEWLGRYNEIRLHDALGSLPQARYRELLLARRNSNCEMSN